MTPKQSQSDFQAGIDVDVSKVEVTHTPLALLPAHAAIEVTSIGGRAVVNRLDQP